jgi:tetratricopeptide (TPR) repeat protein
LIRQLLSLDYRLYWHVTSLFNPKNYFGVREDIFAASSVNMLGIHASLPQAVTGFQEITGPDDLWPGVSGETPRGAPPDADTGVIMVGLSSTQERAANSADELNQIGIRLAQQGRLEEALLSFRRALQIQPGLAQTHNNLGIALQDQGRLDEAVASYRRALALKPGYAMACNNLGTALKDQGKLEEAAACFRRALQLKPDDAMACSNLADALKEQGRLAEAAACYRRALELKPDFAEGYTDLGCVLRDQGNLDEAVACYRRALELKPDLAEALANLGVAVRDQGNLDEAIACQRRALELKPDFAVAHANLGIVLVDQGRLAEAMACYRRALELKPDLPEARLNRALDWLLSGDFQHGWPEYEWRWRTKGHPRLSFRQPFWDGRPLEGKTILLHAEQGLGDTIQFVRYAAWVKDRGPKVIVTCQEPLVRLLASCRGIDELIGWGNDLPPFDFHAPLLSLPGIFQTSLETVPAEVPYLFAAPLLMEQWRKRLGNLEGFKVGIGWQGSPTYAGDRWRSIPLRFFAPLAEIAKVRLVSLQKGAGRDQLAEVGDRFQVADFADEMDETAGAFMDTAAIMTQLDLVITSDTVVAHLAGALGVPVWVALPFAPDWRWLLDRDDSPWYPTMRLFRQKKQRDWAGVFDEIKTALSSRLQGGE